MRPLALAIALAMCAALALTAFAALPPRDAGAPAAVDSGTSAPEATIDAGLAPDAAPTPRQPPGARFDGDDALPAHAVDVADYTMRAKLDPVAHSIHGEGTITWRNTSRVSTSELWIHLYLNAFKNERTEWEKERSGAFRGFERVTDWGTIDVRKLALHEDGGGTTDLWGKAELHRPGDDDETDARVPLPREIAPGEEITLDVVWDDHLPNVIERTGYSGSFHMVGQWFPKLARLEPDGRWAHYPFHHLAEFYSDFGTYDVTLDVPQAFTIGATGPAVDSHVESGRRIERHVQRDVHDFAWTAWDKWQTQSDVVDGVRVTVLYPPGYRVDAIRELHAMRLALPYFGSKLGRYPYEVLTLVHPPLDADEAGGMEYPTLITTGGRWYGPPGIFEIEAIAVHELGHQWFYGMIATNEVEWPFLDEGLNAYAEQSALAAVRGDASVADVAGLKVADSTYHGVGAATVAHDAPIAQPAYEFQTGRDYWCLVYARTATILETMRRVYGDDAFSRALGRYARGYRFEHPGPEELLSTFASVLGEDAAKNMRTALFDEGWVDYQTTYITSGPVLEPGGLFDRDGKRETVNGGARPGYVGSVLVQRLGNLSYPVDIELWRTDGTSTRVRWDGAAASARIPYSGPVPLKAAIVDPDHNALLDEDPTNNFMTAPGQPLEGAPRTFERAQYWASLFLQALLP